MRSAANERVTARRHSHTGAALTIVIVSAVCSFPGAALGDPSRAENRRAFTLTDLSDTWTVGTRISTGFVEYIELALGTTMELRLKAPLFEDLQFDISLPVTLADGNSVRGFSFGNITSTVRRILRLDRGNGHLTLALGASFAVPTAFGKRNTSIVGEMMHVWNRPGRYYFASKTLGLEADARWSDDLVFVQALAAFYRSRFDGGSNFASANKMLRYSGAFGFVIYGSLSGVIEATRTKVIDACGSFDPEWATGCNPPAAKTNSPGHSLSASLGVRYDREAFEFVCAAWLTTVGAGGITLGYARHW